MREALPNATFVGFTGTPLDRDDRSTPRVFGDYADIYDIRQAVEDGATKPIYYESRIIKLLVNEAGVAEAERELSAAAQAAGDGEDLDESVRIPLEALVGAPERIERVAAFIAEHWEKRREAMEGKAMVVTMSRDIAARLYEEIRKLKPEWHDPDDERGAMKVVVTGGPNDAEPLLQHVRSKLARKRLADRYKDPADDFRLVIVCDMWLTGFDCPPMQKAFEQLRGFFHAFDYERALNAEPRATLQVYVNAANHVYAQEDGWKRFRMMVKELAMAFALAVPRPEAEAIAPHLAFFQRVQAMIRKRLADERGTGTPGGERADIDAAVRQVIGGAVDAGEVIDLFAAAGLEDARLDIFSDEFLSRVAALEQKNLALDTLRKLLTDQIRISERVNLVQSKKFREALEDAMVRYTNKAITTAEMIARLLDLAKWVRDVQNRGQDLGLSVEETAFYDAIAENESARKVMENDTLRLMARELAEMVKKLPKLDWTQRESVRADLRRQVRRLLARYGYPPDLSEDATKLVLKQAELSTANGE